MKSLFTTLTVTVILLLVSQSECISQQDTTGSKLDEPAAQLYSMSLKESRFAKDFSSLTTTTVQTSDGRSFYFVWKDREAPEKWIVSLHGAGKPAKGFAMDDMAIWHKHLKGRSVGLISLQWWLGTGDLARDFLSPENMYKEIDLALQSLSVKPGKAMLHGFSRASANSYAIAALDAGKGKKYFSLIVANSGGVALDYPPTTAIVQGKYGDQPLNKTRWITVAGARDPNPDRDGIPGMRRTSKWLQEQGADVVESIEDPMFGHGALSLNPKNAQRVLELFLKDARQ